MAKLGREAVLNQSQNVMSRDVNQIEGHNQNVCGMPHATPIPAQYSTPRL
jgi:hypothetical protein